MPRARLTVAYLQPPDQDELFTAYERDHVPLALSIPGLERFEWSKVLPSHLEATPRYALLAWLTFASMDALGAGLTSPEAQAAAAHVEVIAPNGCDTFVSEVVEP